MLRDILSAATLAAQQRKNSRLHDCYLNILLKEQQIYISSKWKGKVLIVQTTQGSGACVNAAVWIRSLVTLYVNVGSSFTSYGSSLS